MFLIHSSPTCITVCLSVFDKLKEQLTEKGIKSNKEDIATVIEKFCAQKKMGPKDKKIVRPDFHIESGREKLIILVHASATTYSR